MNTRSSIRSWARFDRAIRYSDSRLLQKLPTFPNAILVAGCQRSGTTAVTRILRTALGNKYPALTSDDELDAALILCGQSEFMSESRCCFQSTYLNNRFEEYFDHDNFSLIWIIRNPQAVIRSMLFNWRRSALNRLFRSCGQSALDADARERFDRFGKFAFSRLQKACFSYSAKTAQVHPIAEHLGKERIYIVDYDDLLQNKEAELPALFQFANIPFNDEFLGMLKSRESARRDRFDDRTKSQISEICDAEYHRARELARRWSTENETQL